MGAYEDLDPRPPTAKTVLARIGYGLGSIAASAWVGVMLIGAGPGSATMGEIYPVVEPALDFLNVDNEWGFFAPNPGVGTIVRYRVTDGDGEVHEYRLHEDLERIDPMFLRYTTLYMSIVDSPEDYEQYAVRFLCRQHEDLAPKQVEMIAAEQAVVTPEEFLEGTGILDGLDRDVRPARTCPDGEPVR